MLFIKETYPLPEERYPFFLRCGLFYPFCFCRCPNGRKGEVRRLQCDLFQITECREQFRRAAFCYGANPGIREGGNGEFFIIVLNDESIRTGGAGGRIGW